MHIHTYSHIRNTHIHSHSLARKRLIVFTCVCAGVQMHVCNREHYGFLPVPLKAHQNLEEEKESFTHTITEAMSEYTHTPK